MKKSRAIFKDASQFLISQKIDEHIFDNFDELNESILDDLDAQSSKSSASQIAKDTVAKYSCSALFVLKIRSGNTATTTDLKLVSERLSEICEQSRLFKNSSLNTIMLEAADSDTGEVIDEELNPNDLKPGYDTLIDFFKKTDHKGLYVTLPEAEIAFDVSFEPNPKLTLEKYADCLRQFMDNVTPIITRHKRDFGYVKFYAYNKPNLSCTFPFFRPLSPIIIIETYELTYDTEIEKNLDDFEKEINSKAREQFTRNMPRLLEQSMKLNEQMNNKHGVWVEYDSFRWIARNSFLIQARVSQRFNDEPVSVTNVLYTLTYTLFFYLPDSVLMNNAVCVSVTSDEPIEYLGNKTCDLGRPDQVRYNDKLYMNTSARPWCMELKDNKDKEVRTNRFVRVMLGRGDDMNSTDIPVGVIFPQKNGHIAQKWYDLKVKYSGNLKHVPWFQPFLEANLIDWTSRK